MSAAVAFDERVTNEFVRYAGVTPRTQEPTAPTTQPR